MSCRKSTLKKYTSRPSPPYPAQDCKGEKKKGQNGKWYISSSTSKGVYRWIPIHETRKAKGVKSYEIHDNGGRPFVVEVNPSKKVVDVFLNEFIEDSDKYTKGKLILHTAYSNIFIGEDKTPEYKYKTSEMKNKGNTILLQVSGSKYIYIGESIKSFETHGGEKINKYYSPIGNSDVPYPYAIGETHTYFMLDMETIPNNLLDLKMDGYPQYYGHAFRNPKAYGYTEKASKEREDYFKKIVEPSKKKIPHKSLYRRKM